MADHDTPDDPFLERRLATLALLPVAERPSLDDLAARGVDEDDDLAARARGGVDQHRRSHRVWLLTGAAAAVVLIVISIAAVARSRDGGVAPETGASSPDTGTAGVVALFGPRWEVEAVVDGAIRTSAEPMNGTPRAFVRFAADPDRFAEVVRASDGCDAIGGDVAVLDTTITFSSMSRSDVACQGGAPGHVAEAMAAVLSGEATYATDGVTLTIRNGDRSLELRSVDDPAEDPAPIVVQGWWTASNVGEDDRTVTFTLGCALTGAERFDHAVVDTHFDQVSVAAMVATPSQLGADVPCSAGDHGTFTVVLDEPLDGRPVTQPSRPTPTPPDR